MSKKKNHQINNNKRRKSDSDSDDEDDNNHKKKKQFKITNNQSNHLELMEIPTQHFNKFVKSFWNDNESNNINIDDLKLIRKSLGINVKGNINNCPPPVDSITSKGLPNIFKEIFDHLSLKVPSIVQRQCWPAILNGANILCIATTGSGKTLGYLLPMIPHILSRSKTDKCKIFDKSAPFGLILTPTRELAIQVNSVVKSFKKYSNINSLAIYGGEDKEKQIDQLSNSLGIHVIVATPGRLIDLYANKKISLQLITYLVIDEADKMLSLGFQEQITAISNQIDKSRQTLLFSATFPGKLRDIANDWLSDAVIIRCNTIDITSSIQNTTENITSVDNSDELDDVNQNSTVHEIVNGNSSNDNTELLDKVDSNSNANSIYTVSSTIEQKVHLCSTHKKPRLLIRYLERIHEEELLIPNNRTTNLIIIFCNKIKTINYLSTFLNKQKLIYNQKNELNNKKLSNYLNYSILHSKLTQNQRTLNLSNFTSGKNKILLTTDIASRGIHIKQCKYVINYDFPSNIELYCHRIGRVGRVGKQGYSYSLFSRNYINLLNSLILLLQSCNQIIEPNLLQLYNEYNSGSMKENNDNLDDGNDNDDDGENNDDNYNNDS